MRQVSRLGATRAIRSMLLAVGVFGAASCGAVQAVALPTLPDAGLFAVFETTLGTFACELAYELAPVTVGNFVCLAQGTQEFLDPRSKKWVRRPFYDGLKFHRIMQEFVIQGGDPLGDGTGGPGYTFLDEFSSELPHDRPGVLSMANSGPATNGSQFFVTLKAAPQLNNRHSVFGRVVVGMEVVETIAAQRLMGRRQSTPVTDIVINKLTIVRRGDAANAFDAPAAFAQQAEIIAQRARQKQERSEEFHREMERSMASATTTESGMKYVVLSSGDGKPPRSGDMVTVHYVGYLEDGSQFDSSYERNAPFRFPVGNGQVIKGWDEVFLLMMQGEKVRVVIPPKLAYGQQGKRRYGIPPGATLVFDVELVDIFRP